MKCLLADAMPSMCRMESVLETSTPQLTHAQLYSSKPTTSQTTARQGSHEHEQVRQLDSLRYALNVCKIVLFSLLICLEANEFKGLNN